MANSKRSTGILFLRVLIPIAILAGGIVAFVAISEGLREPPPQEDNQKALATAAVAIVRHHEEGMTIEADGIVAPYREVKVSAEVAGRIVERAENGRAGYFVEKGQLLATIDERDYQLDVERLRKEVQQAKVALEELGEQIHGAESLGEIASKELALRTRELTRLQKLGRTAISVSDLEKSEVAQLAAQNAFVTLRNRVQLLKIGQARLESARDLAELQLKKALLDLERTKVFAPADGVIVADYIEEDAYVQRGTPLFTLEDTAKAEVKCKLQMEDLYWLWDRADSTTASADRDVSESSPAETAVAEAYDIPDVQVEVIYQLAGFEDLAYTWSGRLERYDGLGLDEKTRTVPCRVVVDRPRHRVPSDRSGPPALLRGMYVTIRIHITPRTPLLEIPEKGIRGGNRVWCVRDGKLAIIPVHYVTLLTRTDAAGNEMRQALVYIDNANSSQDKSVLVAGDQVIVSPLVFVRTGMDIEVSRVVETASP